MFLNKNPFISSSQNANEVGTMITFYRQGNKKAFSQWLILLHCLLVPGPLVSNEWKISV